MIAGSIGGAGRTGIVLGVLLLASPLWAQEPPAAPQAPAANFVELMARISRGDRISVTNLQGRQVQGRLKDLSPTSLTLDGTVFEVDDVQSVERKGGRKIGRETVRGLAGGAGVAFAIVTAGGSSSTAGVKTIVDVSLAGAVVGTVIGFFKGIFVPTKTGTVYRAPAPETERRLSVAPLVTTGTRGAVLQYSF